MSEPTEGRWTTEPPTVPGWYWRRYSGQAAVIVYMLRPMKINGREWWSVPIQSRRDDTTAGISKGVLSVRLARHRRSSP